MVKNLPDSAGAIRDMGSTPGSERFPGEGNGNLLQYSCLENSMDIGDWWATVYGVSKSRTRLSDFTYLLMDEKQFLKNYYKKKQEVNLAGR